MICMAFFVCKSVSESDASGSFLLDSSVGGDAVSTSDLVPGSCSSAGGPPGPSLEGASSEGSVPEVLGSTERSSLVGSVSRVLEDSEGG